MELRRAVRYVRPSSTSASTGVLPELEVVHTVHDDADTGRSQLPAALERIAGGEAAVLFVPELRMVAGSLRELVDLLDWLDTSSASLVAADVGLDTASSAGRATTSLLREVAAWEEEPDTERPHRGRPGLSRLSPELAERIAALRSQGMTLQGIADHLNAEGTPTPRGGMRWRPSSVQSALGYRRPRPPGPGLPPLPPAPPPPPAHRGPGRRPARGDEPGPPGGESRPPAPGGESRPPAAGGEPRPPAPGTKRPRRAPGAESRPPKPATDPPPPTPGGEPRPPKPATAPPRPRRRP